MPTSNFPPIRLLDPNCCYKFTYLIANSADPDQLAFAKTGHVVFNKRRVKNQPDTPLLEIDRSEE